MLVLLLVEAVGELEHVPLLVGAQVPRDLAELHLGVGERGVEELERLVLRVAGLALVVADGFQLACDGVVLSCTFEPPEKDSVSLRVGVDLLCLLDSLVDNCVYTILCRSFGVQNKASEFDDAIYLGVVHSC